MGYPTSDGHFTESAKSKYLCLSMSYYIKYVTINDMKNLLANINCSPHFIKKKERSLSCSYFTTISDCISYFILFYFVFLQHLSSLTHVLKEEHSGGLLFNISWPIIR